MSSIVGKGNGNARKNYISEITRLLNSWINENTIKYIGFKTLMLMPNLLLQKPSKSSKAKDHLKALGRRLGLWNQGNLNKLLYEAISIQKSLKTISLLRVIRET